MDSKSPEPHKSSGAFLFGGYMRIVQVQLREVNTTGILTTWVDKKPGLKKGSIVTLKDQKERKWEVLEIYSPEKEHTELHRGWNNNI
jgi:hypothetical protein